MVNYIGNNEFERLVEDLDYKLSILAEPVTLTADQLTAVKILIARHREQTDYIQYLEGRLRQLIQEHNN